MSTNVNKKLVIKNIQTPEDIIDVLVQLGDVDSDFNGGNGDEYLWPTAAKKGFESNAEYLADYVVFHSNANSKKYGVKAYTDRFIKEWLKRESYYASIEIDVVKLDGLAEDPDMTGIYAFNITTTDYN